MAEGDKVALHVINTGTHKGEFLGIPPTNKKVPFVGVGFLTIRDGKIVEQWSINDVAALMQQIGAIPVASPMSTADTTR
jgi:predicted ester cyclase